MIKEAGGSGRSLKTVTLNSQLVVVGGGLSGTCCAITAARCGLKVVLVQDRPVLGGNASTEVRLWVLGATSHMGNNNRWAREGGVINEIMLENAYRNPDGNPIIFDTILLEKVVNEKNITLLLNTAVYELEKKDAGTIESITAFCSQNSTRYKINSPLFCDASGDGIVGFMAGAAFRMGAESGDEFNEKFAPSKEYGELLGHSMYFYSKDAGRPVKFVPPSFALQDITKIPRYKKFTPKEFGCQLWWIEYGGRLDTVHETETIKWELWKVIYGVWNYIKNSGNFPEAETLTLEWVGTIPGKRESRRFEGDYILKQQDIIEQRQFDDIVAFGGWSIDLHPADGVFSEKPGCNQWHSKGIYGIPYRCYYSRNISNLFIAGRIISASHVAFGSTRVMATGAHGGQAIGVAALLCHKYNLQPKQVGEKYLAELQQELLKQGQHLPGKALCDENDLVQQATITASSVLTLGEIPFSGSRTTLLKSAAQMLPVSPGKMPAITVSFYADEDTTLKVELRKSSKAFNHTPDQTMETKTIVLKKGGQTVQIDFDTVFDEACYAFVCFMKNEQVQLPYSNKQITGILSVFNGINSAVSNFGKQEPSEDIGMETFEFWCPERRPAGKNIAMKISPGLDAFAAHNLKNGLQRPVASANAWVADYEDQEPLLTISWNEPVAIKQVELFFDADYDNPLENVLLMHPETIMPCCVQEVKVLNCSNQVVAEISNNYQSRQTICFDQPVHTQHLKFKLCNPNQHAPVSLFEVRCYK